MRILTYVLAAALLWAVAANGPGTSTEAAGGPVSQPASPAAPAPMHRR